MKQSLKYHIARLQKHIADREGQLSKREEEITAEISSSRRKHAELFKAGKETSEIKERIIQLEKEKEDFHRWLDVDMHMDTLTFVMTGSTSGQVLIPSLFGTGRSINCVWKWHREPGVWLIDNRSIKDFDVSGVESPEQHFVDTFKYVEVQVHALDRAIRDQLVVIGKSLADQYKPGDIIHLFDTQMKKKCRVINKSEPIGYRVEMSIQPLINQ